MANNAEQISTSWGLHFQPRQPLLRITYPLRLQEIFSQFLGKYPWAPNGLEYVGKLGENTDVETGQAAARLCAINILAQAKAALGDLSRIKQVMKIQGYVNSTADFTAHPTVINGASDLLVEVLGVAGKHARAAVGMSSLPLGVAVEIDAVIEIT